MTTGVPHARRLDELVLEHLANQRTPEVDELAVTGRFVRPYERVEVQAKPRTYVKTVRRVAKGTPVTGTRTALAPVAALAPVELDVAWFGSSEDALAAIEEPPDLEEKTSWTWLGISLAVGAAAVTAMYMFW
jgi:hypothetical protein